MKLGEALIKEALITREQLEQALKRQVQFGGRIGTNIVELRFIEEEELLKFMSRHFRLPAIPPEGLNAVPEEVINAISRELINKFKILAHWDHHCFGITFGNIFIPLKSRPAKPRRANIGFGAAAA